MRPAAAVVLAAWLTASLLAGAAAAEEEVLVVKPAHRTAADLVPAVAAALGSGGGVAVDERTGSLVIHGDPAALRRARAVLTQLDVKPRTILIEAKSVGQDEFESLGVAVAWTASGGWRIGRLPDDGASRDGTLTMKTGAKTRISRSSDAARVSVRVLEGETATLIAGRKQEYRPDRLGWSEITGPALGARVRDIQTSLTVRPRVVGDQIELQFTPDATTFGPDGPRPYHGIAAATTVRVKNGGQIVIGAASSQSSAQLVDVFRGLSAESAGGSQALLVRAQIEEE